MTQSLCASVYHQDDWEDEISEPESGPEDRAGLSPCGHAGQSRSPSSSGPPGQPAVPLCPFPSRICILVFSARNVLPPVPQGQLTVLFEGLLRAQVTLLPPQKWGALAEWFAPLCSAGTEVMMSAQHSQKYSVASLTVRVGTHPSQNVLAP